VSNLYHITRYTASAVLKAMSNNLRIDYKINGIRDPHFEQSNRGRTFYCAVRASSWRAQVARAAKCTSCSTQKTGPYDITVHSTYLERRPLSQEYLFNKHKLLGNVSIVMSIRFVRIIRERSY